MNLKLFILIVILFGFSSPQSELDKIFISISQIKGGWQMETRKGAIYEEWSMGDNKNLIGNSYKLKYSDTILLEDLEIKIEKNSIYYISKVMDQNDQKPIYFNLIKSKNNIFVFENKQHDYPQRIIYRFVSNDSLVARIEGNKLNKILSSEFYYSRVKYKN